MGRKGKSNEFFIRSRGPGVQKHATMRGPGPKYRYHSRGPGVKKLNVDPWTPGKISLDRVKE